MEIRMEYCNVSRYKTFFQNPEFLFYHKSLRALPDLQASHQLAKCVQFKPST